jgi:hypothetical protein
LNTTNAICGGSAFLNFKITAWTRSSTWVATLSLNTILVKNTIKIKNEDVPNLQTKKKENSSHGSQFFDTDAPRSKFLEKTFFSNFNVEILKCIIKKYVFYL